MVDHRTGVAARTTWAEAEERSSGDERHLLGATGGRSMAGPPRALRSLYDGLQSLQSLAESRHLGPPDGCRDEGTRWAGPDDRQLDRAGPSTCLWGKKNSGDRCVGRSRGGLTTKIHARVDGQGRPIQILITPGQAHDLTGAEPLLANLARRTVVIADKAYDADRLRAHI